LLVIDELGKFLEHAAATGGDIMALQTLAEAAARSGAQPLVLLTILHQGLTSYAESAAAASRSEWAKVAERFEELSFDHPLTHTAALVAAAFDPDMAALPAAARRSLRHACAEVDAIGWIPSGTVSDARPATRCIRRSLAVAPRFFSYVRPKRALAVRLPSIGRALWRARLQSPQVRETGILYRLDDFFDFVAACFRRANHRPERRCRLEPYSGRGASYNGSTAAGSPQILKSLAC
jgi:hypothetical protein